MKYVSPINCSLFPDHSEPGWIPVDGVGHYWIQDKVVSSGPSHLAQHPQLLFQRLVDHPSLQANERLPQV